METADKTSLSLHFKDILFFKPGYFGGSIRITPLEPMEHSAQKKERKKIEENVTIAPIRYIIATGSQCTQKTTKKQKKEKKNQNTTKTKIHTQHKRKPHPGKGGKPNGKVTFCQEGFKHQGFSIF